MLTHSGRKGKEGWLNQRLACPSKSFQGNFQNFFQSSCRVSFVKFQLPHPPRRKRKFQQPSFFHCLNSHLPQDFPPLPIVSPFSPSNEDLFFFISNGRMLPSVPADLQRRKERPQQAKGVIHPRFECRRTQNNTLLSLEETDGGGYFLIRTPLLFLLFSLSNLRS